MPLLYSCVSQAFAVLADYAVVAGNFGAVAREYLVRAGQTEGRSVFLVDGHTFNFLHTGGFLYLVVADEHYGRAIPEAFLDRVAREFAERWAGKVPSTATDGTLSAFSKQLRFLMEQAMQNPAEFTRTAAVHSRVNEVKDIMVENIGRVVAQTERIEALDAKTEVLQFEADRFVRTARSIRRKAWWQSCKMRILIAFAVVMLGLIIFLLVCFSGGNCLKHG
ncbi:hypothetical protein GPECTOR_16g624 [Gonium pectorale]|uniref:Uncharacterized protein n=1 Tax=Gonium pectorale TaxID=33097 RepID=A0A150GM98_GONPE|nr:hypothetical protein GPECTOR_16g624 [Gonium pectorale]|eukprot:KXZ50450.1 hypothetical protein GPECTOR_16g624 [Gonium pectorale]